MKIEIDALFVMSRLIFKDGKLDIWQASSTSFIWIKVFCLFNKFLPQQIYCCM